MAAPSSLDPGSRAVRTAYIQAMRSWLERHRGHHQEYGDRGLGRWDGGKDPYSGKPTAPIWPELRDFLAARSADPTTYMTAAFTLTTAHPPTPRQLMSAAHAADYQTRHAQVVRALELELRADLDRAWVAFRTHQRYCPRADQDSWRAILQDRSLVITPLTRWVVAGLYGLGEVQEAFCEEAVAQYLRRPALYSQAWSAIMPESAMPLAGGPQ